MEDKTRKHLWSYQFFF